MKMSYPSNVASRPYRPLVYAPSNPLSDFVQTLAGLAFFFAALYAWHRLSRLLPDDGWRAWVLLALFAALLVAVELLARNEWDWDRLRLGMVLGLLAVAGYWIVKVAMLQLGYAAGA
jgi:hypothetical protein